MAECLCLEDYQPRSELVVPEHPVSRARFPVVDAHNHVTYPGFGWQDRDVHQVLDELDALNVRTVVNLSGGSGDELKRNLERWDLAFPGRFVSYCNADFADIDAPGWSSRACAQLRADIAAGARGLKVYKELGLTYRDGAGRLFMPDDARLFDLWEQAGELGIPVTIHTADPVAFFRPLDRHNERWEELRRFPEWHFYGRDYPSFDALIESLYHLVETHPRTTFVTAHVGCYPENLGFVSRMLERYPNLYTDIGARIAELGRQPYAARQFFLRHAGRILFGTDHHPSPAMYRVHFRFLETDDEYFAYDAESPIPTQGRWRIYGLYLPDEVLRRVYHANAECLLHL